MVALEAEDHWYAMPAMKWEADGLAEARWQQRPSTALPKVEVEVVEVTAEQHMAVLEATALEAAVVR